LNTAGGSYATRYRSRVFSVRQPERLDQLHHANGERPSKPRRRATVQPFVDRGIEFRSMCDRVVRQLPTQVRSRR
jgi:hypothetical protein